MRRLALLLVVGAFGAACSGGDTPLKDAYAAAFGVGVAVSAAQLDRAAKPNC